MSFWLKASNRDWVRCPFTHLTTCSVSIVYVVWWSTLLVIPPMIVALSHSQSVHLVPIDVCIVSRSVGTLSLSFNPTQAVGRQRWTWLCYNCHLIGSIVLVVPSLRWRQSLSSLLHQSLFESYRPPIDSITYSHHVSISLINHSRPPQLFGIVLILGHDKCPSFSDVSLQISFHWMSFHHLNTNS